MHMGTPQWRATLQVQAVSVLALEASAPPLHSRKVMAQREKERLRETSTQATGQP